MRLLNLANGEFQVYSAPRGKYNVYFLKSDGKHYACYPNITERRLNEVVKAWTRLKYIRKCI